MPRIVGIISGSIAEEGGVKAGDELLMINGERITDIFDYLFLVESRELEILLRSEDSRGSEDGCGCEDSREWILEVEKDEAEDIGFIFEDGMLDAPRACGNHCVFCFIDQLPNGMRESLYFKDDDIRMSFTNGNYVTLTNVSHDELRRIARYRLSPVNVSVHTTDPFLRAKMLGFAAPSAQQLERYNILPKIVYLTEMGIAVNAQIVLCRNYNDGAALDATLSDLNRLNAFVSSISVVPSGLTKHRSGLPYLEAFDADAATKTIRQVENWQKIFRQSHESRTVYAADELYVLAGKRIPGHNAYEGYPQLENGVGMSALFKKQFDDGIRSLCRRKQNYRPCSSAPPTASILPATSAHPTTSILPATSAPSTASVPPAPPTSPASSAPPTYILTGRASIGLLEHCANKIRAILPDMIIHVIPVVNTFFGDLVTVSGLLTGIDLIKCIDKLKYPPNSRFFISKTMLKHDSELFLDDYTLEMLRKKLKIDIIAVENDGRALIKALLQGAVA